MELLAEALGKDRMVAHWWRGLKESLAFYSAHHGIGSCPHTTLPLLAENSLTITG